MLDGGDFLFLMTNTITTDTVRMISIKETNDNVMMLDLDCVILRYWRMGRWMIIVILLEL